MADEIAKKFAENALAFYGFGIAFFVVAVALLIWHAATEDKPEWLKLVSLGGVIGGLLLILGTFSSNVDVKHACESGRIPPEVCLQQFHVNPYPLPTFAPLPIPAFGDGPSP